MLWCTMTLLKVHRAQLYNSVSYLSKNLAAMRATSALSLLPSALAQAASFVPNPANDLCNANAY
jgi:hypothetical protein